MTFHVIQVEWILFQLVHADELSFHHENGTIWKSWKEWPLVSRHPCCLWSGPAPGSTTPLTDLLFPCVLWGHWPEELSEVYYLLWSAPSLHKGAMSFQLIETVIDVVSSRCPCRCPYSVLQTVSSLPAAVSVLSGFYLESLHHSIKGSHAFAELLYLSVWGHLPPFCSTDLQLVRHVGNVDAV